MSAGFLKAKAVRKRGIGLQFYYFGLLFICLIAKWMQLDHFLWTIYMDKMWKIKGLAWKYAQVVRYEDSDMEAVIMGMEIRLFRLRDKWTFIHCFHLEAGKQIDSN